jgi:hypothetical protein
MFNDVLGHLYGVERVEAVTQSFEGVKGVKAFFSLH